MQLINNILDLVMLTIKFNVLASNWKKETAMLSSITAMADHPSYRAIITLGMPVVPLLLQDLKRDDNPSNAFWYMALEEITGHDIQLPERYMGNIEVIRNHWLSWGWWKGYLK